MNIVIALARWTDQEKQGLERLIKEKKMKVTRDDRGISIVFTADYIALKPMVVRHVFAQIEAHAGLQTSRIHNGIFVYTTLPTIEHVAYELSKVALHKGPWIKVVNSNWPMVKRETIEAACNKGVALFAEGEKLEAVTRRAAIWMAKVATRKGVSNAIWRAQMLTELGHISDNAGQSVNKLTPERAFAARQLLVGGHMRSACWVMRKGKRYLRAPCIVNPEKLSPEDLQLMEDLLVRYKQKIREVGRPITWQEMLEIFGLE